MKNRTLLISSCRSCREETMSWNMIFVHIKRKKKLTLYIRWMNGESKLFFFWVNHRIILWIFYFNSCCCLSLFFVTFFISLLCCCFIYVYTAKFNGNLSLVMLLFCFVSNDIRQKSLIMTFRFKLNQFVTFFKPLYIIELPRIYLKIFYYLKRFLVRSKYLRIIW